MPITAQATQSFEKAPAGLQKAVCVDVRDMGIERSEKYGNEQHKILITWQLEEKMDSGKRYIISRKFTLSLNEKAALRAFLEAWRGKPFSDAELRNGFDVEKLIGVNCYLQIFHTEDGKYANVVNIMPLRGGEETLEPENYTRFIHRDETANGNGSAKQEPQPQVDLTGVEVPF